MYKKHGVRIAILVLFLITAIFSACSPNSTEESSGSQEGLPQSSQSEKTKLVVWGAIQPEMGPLEACAKFTEQNPDIEVEYIRYVNDDNGNLKLDTTLMAGEDIDVFFSYNDATFSKRVMGGMTEELTSLMEKYDFKPEENYKSYPTYNGKVYCLPTTVTSRFIYVNMDMIEAAGLELPTEWTIDEYMDYVKKLTKEENGVKVYGGFWDWTNSCLNMFHVQTLGDNAFYKDGGKTTPLESNFDHPIFKQSIDIFSKVMLEDKSQPSFIEIETSKLTPSGEFLTGKVATFAESASHLRNINNLEQYPHTFKTGFAPFPTMSEGADEYTWKGYFSDVISINSASKNKDAAWKFVEFFGTEGQQYMFGAGKYPSWNGIDEDLLIDGLLGENAEELYDIESFKRVVINNDKKYYNNTEFTAFPQITNIWKEEVQKVIGGEQDSTQAVINAKERADAEIQKATE